MRELGLHYYTPKANEWYACAYPERPHDSGAIYDEDCPRCLLKAQATLHIHGDISLIDPSHIGAGLCLLSELGQP